MKATLKFLVTLFLLSALVSAATINVQATVHYVDSKANCFGFGKTSVKLPATNMQVYLFKASDVRAFADQYAYNYNWEVYAPLLESGAVQPVATCTTDSNGACSFDVAADDYYVISGYVLGCQPDVHSGKQVSANDMKKGTNVNLNLMRAATKDCTVKMCYPAEATVLSGSNLEIVQPEYVVWDSATAVYPFALSSDSDWTVDITPYLPSGYVASPSAVVETVANEIKGVAFDVTEVGSKMGDTTVVIGATHNGKKQTLRLTIGGKDSPAWEAKKASKKAPFAALIGSTEGIIVLVGVAAIAFAIGYLLRKK